MGSGGITVLTNDNYVVQSPLWNWASGEAGATTWGSEVSGVKGVVSAANSLINNLPTGASLEVTALANGNYVVDTPGWNSGAGAVTWGNGTTGISGTISNTNSLVGSNSNDNVGSGPVNNGITNGDGVGGVIGLTNGNYVVDSPLWNNGMGAVTWANGSAATVAAVSTDNSLVGSGALGAASRLWPTATMSWLARPGTILRVRRHGGTARRAP